MAVNKKIGGKAQSANDFLAPYAPTIGTATDIGTGRAYNDGAATVTFTATGPNTATSYTVYAVEDNTKTATGSSSPLTVTGLASGTNYTFKVYGTNSTGNGDASATSNQINATTVPQAPTIGTASNVPSARPYNNGRVDVAFTAGATGGKSITGYTALSSGAQTGTGAGTPVTVTGLASANNYTFQVKATNANGDSLYSTASNIATVTTVPATPAAPTASSPSAGVDRVSWTAPANGGSAITNYFWSSSDSKSGNTSSTTVDVTQEQGTSQTYTVRADNTNGSSGTSPASPSVTTVYSFVPYSFTPYSFVPYSFTPFSAFGAFGAFSAFGAFGAFSAFGAFGAFSAFGAYSFSPGKSIGVDTLVLTTEGYTLAKNLKVGDVLVSADIPGLGTSFTKEEMIAWTNDPQNIVVVPDKQTTIMNIGISTATVAVMIGNELYSGTHYMLTQRDGVAQMIQSEDLLTTDKLWSTSSNSWVDITELVITNIPHEVVSIDCEPNDMFFTDHFLVYDGYQIEY